MVDAAAPRLPIAVLASGSGSNLAALITATASPDHRAAIVVVITDRDEVGALEHARAAGIPTRVVAWRDFADRESFTTAVCDAAEGAGAAALVLAGFMRILTGSAIARFPNRILNTHPSLLPAFPGAHAVADALAYGARCTGVTIHFVDEQMDHGPIIYQEAVAVREGDDVASLTAQIQAIEHSVYPRVVDALAAGNLNITGRRVTWSGAP